MASDPKLVPLEATLMIETRLSLVDLIDWNGELWVVMLWYANQDEELRKPRFVMPLSAVKHHVNTTDPKRPRYLIEGVFPEQPHWDRATRVERRHLKIRRGPDFAFPMALPKQ